MALDQSALLELLEALKAADADDVVRQALQAVLQALIEAYFTGSSQTCGSLPPVSWSWPSSSACSSPAC
ncbi:hypothetical protein ABT329_41250, partial [Streptomyces minutiscleroticus]